MILAGRGGARIVLAGALAVAVSLAIHFWIVESAPPGTAMLRVLPFAVLYAGGQLVLATIFGRTLRAGHEPLCTRFARVIHGTLRPDVERYTRAVTLAWTVFFATLFSLSLALYLAGALEAWSVLANILTWLLVAAMFIVEYAIRHRVLKDWDHVSFGTAVRAFAHHVSRSEAR